jgi:hypothetical protein
MAYLEFENLDEDVRATLHNFVSGMIAGKHNNVDKHTIFPNIQKGFEKFMIGVNPLGTLAQAGLKLIGARDIMDRAFFNRYWESEKIARLVEPWCKEEKRAVFVSENNTNKMLNRDPKMLLGKKQKEHTAAKSNTYLANPSLFKKGERQDKFTKAITCLPIRSGNGFYYVYPIFDTGEIKSIKILCTRNKSNTDLYVKTLKQWNSVDQSQFKKNVII